MIEVCGEMQREKHASLKNLKEEVKYDENAIVFFRKDNCCKFSIINISYTPPLICVVEVRRALVDA